MGTIYNLDYEFSTQNGQTIVFTERDGSSLTPKDLHAVQLKMIQSNQIPHMLPLALEHIDLAAKLHYDIQSKQRLVTYLRDNKTTTNDYYQLFLSIINTLEDASSYMLDQNNYILQMEFLYIGQHAGDVYLTYLPIKDVEKKTTVTDDLKELLTDVAGEIEGLQGNEFKSILNYIKNSAFSISGLKKLLLELISLRSNVYQPQFDHQVAVSPNGETEQYGQIEKATPNAPQEKIVAGSENGKQKKKKTKKKLPPLTSRERLYLILASVLLIAFSWKLTDVNSSMNMVSLGLTVLILAGAITYWKVWRPGVSAVEEKVESSSNQEDQVKAQSPTPQPAFQMKQERESFQPAVRAPQLQQAFQPVLAAQTSAAAAMDTTLLNVDHDDTVLLEDLEPEIGIEPTPVKLPVLTRISEDEEAVQIEVDASNFLIGRNEEAVNYTELALGVSRIHLEVVKLNDSSYGIKDLGSKNGSKINGNPMVPYKLYALEENDEITIGKAQYTFNWSNEQ